MDTTADAGLIGKTLLIVEDDWLLQNLLSVKLTPLREQGVNIVSVFDGEKAVVAARAQRPDAILLDILLPGMTGFDFLEMLQKEDPTFKNVPVIVFSNLNSSEDRERAKTLGVREFMAKAESTPEQIVSTLGEVLSKV